MTNKKLIVLLTAVIIYMLPAADFDFSDLVEKQKSSVVNIESTRKVSVSRRTMGGFPEELFREFGFPMPEYDEPRQSQREAVSSGSGFVLSKDGYIVTNYHVIEGCSSNPKIKYKDQDVNTKVIAKDKMLDLALLKANLTNTKYVSLSNDKPKKLQRVIASGYPFGKYISDDLKFTSGIISSLKGPNDDSTLLQVDAALNVGNSGGPIVDEKSGKLVAVSVMGMKKSISEGQNFGIKTSSVKNFLQTNKVKVPSSWFGASDVAKLLEDTTLYTFCR